MRIVIALCSAVALLAAWLLFSQAPADFRAELSLSSRSPAPNQPWPHYGGTEGGGRHTPLRQIDASNIQHLEVAWTFRTGETGSGDTVSKRLTFEATPIVIGDTMFVSTAYGRVFALDARSGHERWRFEARIDPKQRYAEAANRSVAA